MERRSRPLLARMRQGQRDINLANLKGVFSVRRAGHDLIRLKSETNREQFLTMEIDELTTMIDSG